MKIRLQGAAQNDLVEGYHFYERSEQGCGDYFLATLYSEIESLRIFGGIHRKEYKNLHRVLSRKFPFAIYYTLADDEVIVRAILDCRRNPSWIRSKIKNAE